MKEFIQTKSFKLAVNIEGDKDSLKLALVLPGRMDTKDYANLVSHTRFLASKGFLAVSFDPPGTWESGGDPLLYSMTNYIKAVDELIEYFGNKSTLLVGHSRGASISIFAGVSNLHVEAFVSIMGKASYKDPFPIDPDWKNRGYKIEYRDPPPGDPDRRKELQFKLDYAFLEDSMQYDASKELAECTKPKLFIAGEKDVLVPPEVVKGVYNLAAEPKEYKTIPGSHDYRYTKGYIDQVNHLIDNFLNRYKIR